MKLLIHSEAPLMIITILDILMVLFGLAIKTTHFCTGEEMNVVFWANLTLCIPLPITQGDCLAQEDAGDWVLFTYPKACLHTSSSHLSDSFHPQNAISFLGQTRRQEDNPAVGMWTLIKQPFWMEIL